MVSGLYPERFLDDLRAALRVSEVVGRRVKLAKKGAEFVGLSPFSKEKTPSFTVNDEKRFYHDFSSGKHGDIFDFEMQAAGCTFTQAVEELAKLAGIPLPRRAGHRNGAANGRAAGDNAMPTDDGRPLAEHPNAPSSAAPKREITRTHDYHDADGALAYQVCRMEWSEDGKRKKTFLQRRPIDGEPGRWAWGLKGGEYVRSRTGDFYQLTEARQVWTGERRKFEEVAHALYRFPELREEMVQDAAERRPVFSPEGEKDCDTLAAWGMVATDSSGGSTNWSWHHAEHLRGADVVIVADNDAPGRKYAHAKAASLRGVAARIRVLEIRDVWQHAPDGADVTDWRDHGGGTAEKLFAAIDRLPDWTPVRPDSQFNAVPFFDLDAPARELEWLIKRVLTRGEVSIWYGPPGCGKSFLLTDAGMAIARGNSWFGLRTRQGLVVYQAGEGGLGLKRRLRAYRARHNMRHDEEVPFVLLPTRVDLFAGDVDLKKLIDEIKAWAAYYDAPLELVAIDTFSSASPGANENASEDVTKVLDRCHRIAVETGAHVALVHHTPKAGGSPRGHSSFMGNVENALEVDRSDQVDAEETPSGRVTRDIRSFTVRKQKDAEDGLSLPFVLKQVILGQDNDGDPITSCVVQPLADAPSLPGSGLREIPKGYTQLKPNDLTLMRALQLAIKEKGRVPPPIVHAPQGTYAVTVGEWQEALVAIRFTVDPEDPEGKKVRQKCKKQVERSYGEYGWADPKRRNLIGKDREWVWRSSRKVFQIDELPIVVHGRNGESDMLLAPGEEAADLGDLLASANFTAT